MQPPSREILRSSYRSIRTGSLSFRFAASLFKPAIRDRVVLLYAWCRHIDNITDQSGVSLLERRQALQDLYEATFATSDKVDAPPPVLAIRQLQQEMGLNKTHVQEVFTGMAMDLEGRTYRDLQALHLYCYRVAGVVGLLMCQIMGAANKNAPRHAVDLGIAMQMTNICRDVLEDAQNGRVYLPGLWLQKAGLKSTRDIQARRNRRKVFLLTKKLLAEANGYYRSGELGLKYLPLRSAVAVAVAREVYGGIGTRILNLGSNAWDQRPVVPIRTKVLLALRGIGKAMTTIPHRLRPGKDEL